MMCQSDVAFNIDPEYPMVPGDWDVHFLNATTKEKIVMRIVLCKTTFIKELFLLHDGDLVSARRVR